MRQVQSTQLGQSSDGGGDGACSSARLQLSPIVLDGSSNDVPVSSLNSSLRMSSRCRFLNDRGISPRSWLRSRHRLSRWWSSPNAAGRGPVEGKRRVSLGLGLEGLHWYYQPVSADRQPASHRCISPTRLFELKLSWTRDVMQPMLSDKGPDEGSSRAVE